MKGLRGHEKVVAGRVCAVGKAGWGTVWIVAWGLAAGEVALVHGTVDAGGGRLSAPGVTVDMTLGSLGGLAGVAGPPFAQIRGGYAGSLNEPPVAPDQVWHRPPGVSVKQRVEALLSAVADAEGDEITLVGYGPSVGGAMLGQLGGWLLYDPVAEAVNDQFPYVVDDGIGGRSQGTVYVVVQSVETSPGQNQLGLPQLMPDGRWLLRFLGIPGRAYVLEYADELTGPWQPVPGVPSPWIAPANGLLEAWDDGAATQSRFYRVVSP